MKRGTNEGKSKYGSPTTIVLYWCSGYLTVGFECK